MIRQQLASLPLPDWGQLAEEAVKRLPRASSLVLSGALLMLAPHQRRAGLKLKVWDKRTCEGEMRLTSRWLPWRKASGTTDFALAGELAANLVLIRNLNLLLYRFQLKELNVVSDQDAAETVNVSCTLDPQSFSRLRIGIGEKPETSITLKSDIKNPSGATVAQVRSVWQIQRR